ncbi:SDR family NAD(P)-dependent oxidoreductase [uncultured Helicobacter sp.]|uniref:SDR family oxidoreductase n=1 Tax=uncultured Helicobacter sp. TaxID=175537 RepID=UPI002624D30C|nr:SDR family NAD(P)-dependent oxidoreductase [uncultured Helicobacter sp.]
MQKNKESLERREFLKTSAKLGIGASLVSISGFALSACDSKGDSKQNPKNTQNRAQSGSTKAPQNQGATMNTNPQVWYITGASGGLGLELAKYLLSKGDKVAATSRKLNNIESKLGKEYANFLPLELSFNGDMNAKIAANLEAVKKKFGRLGNVVNNAGYGLLGFVEEVSEKQLREQFEVNVFAPFLVAQNALKIMRPQSIKEGGSTENIKARIFNLSSIGGFRVSNNSTPYCMSKFAISALSEGLLLDVSEYGIHTINVMPAGFRTEFLGTSMVLGDKEVSDYEARRKAFLDRSANYSGKQAGNPQKFAEILYDVSRMQKPPFSLFMGEAAFKSAENKIAWVSEDIKATQGYAGAADFSDSAGSAFDKR